MEFSLSLGIQLNQQEMTSAFSYCLKKFNPMKGNIIEIGLVKLEWKGCVRSITILSKVLL